MDPKPFNPQAAVSLCGTVGEKKLDSFITAIGKVISDGRKEIELVLCQVNCPWNLGAAFYDLVSMIKISAGVNFRSYATGTFRDGGLLICLTGIPFFVSSGTRFWLNTSVERFEGLGGPDNSLESKIRCLEIERAVVLFDTNIMLDGSERCITERVVEDMEEIQLKLCGTPLEA